MLTPSPPGWAALRNGDRLGEEQISTATHADPEPSLFIFPSFLSPEAQNSIYVNVRKMCSDNTEFLKTYFKNYTSVN